MDLEWDSDCSASMDSQSAGRISALEFDISTEEPPRVHADSGPSSSQGELHHRLLGPSLSKSGQSGVDQNAISQIIYRASEGSKYFERQRQQERELTKKVHATLRLAASVSKQELTAAQQRVKVLMKQAESTRVLDQTIVHLDCDAFYASVEELDFPELKTKPFAVGGGVLCTCNYEARKFGVRSAMAEFVAKKICPQLTVLPLNFPKYIEKSNQIKKILREYDSNLCAMTLDEAYMNITKYCEDSNKSRSEIINNMRNRIFRETGVTVSAGIGPNSRVAKIASNINKPNGQFEVENDREAVMNFMATLQVRKLTGVGYVLERQLNALQVLVCGDIGPKSNILHQVMSSSTFSFLLECYLGLGPTVIKPMDQIQRKSVGCETTFSAASDREILRSKLLQVCCDLEKECKRLKLAGRKFGIKFKKDTFESFSRSKPVSKPLSNSAEFFKLGTVMLDAVMPIKIRLIGVRITDLVDLTYEGPMRTYIRSLTANGLDQCRATSSEHQLQDAFKSAKVEVSSEEIETHIPESSGQVRSAIQAMNIVEAQESSTARKRDFPVVCCPICSNRISAESALVNQHIDWCLSRRAIKEALQDSERSMKI
ncbi:uncharacterized protein V1516DRAFT_680087 [Lipomyces oligophaga]|uniref:uncharacterized protein n=1 Tax=Lipomyces oligophaga TaxID=45792 RepID=UPI0034CE7801